MNLIKYISAVYKQIKTEVFKRSLFIITQLIVPR